MIALVKEFTTTDPLRLREQLEKFARNAWDSVRSLEKFLTEPSRQPRRVTTTSPYNEQLVSYGELLLVDAAGGSFELVLPDPATFPARLLTVPAFVIVKVSATNAVTLRPTGATLINGAGSLSLTALAAYDVFSDNVDYWREF